MTGPGHPGPDPTPSPAGPIRTVRDLIRWAREASYDHTQYGTWSDAQHAWIGREWMVELQTWPDSVHVDVYRAKVVGVMRAWEHRLGFDAESVDEFVTMMSALGVLPSIEVVAA